VRLFTAALHLAQTLINQIPVKAVEDVAGRFGLGPKSGQLMQETVRLIMSSPGGVSGFIDKFRSAGLDSEIGSWLGKTDGAVLTGPQVEKALGSTKIGEIASELGLGSRVVATALGYILPKLIGQITPGGVIPTGIPAALFSYLQTTPNQTTTPRASNVIHDATPAWEWLIPVFKSRLRFRHGLGVRDLPVIMGGGVLGMISGEALSVSPILQWALIGGGIAFGVVISVIEWAKPVDAQG
jgi:uncharacterized protein YidB (DUF937 family)